MAPRYLLMLVSELQALPRTPVGRRFKGRLLRLGDPMIERAGVANRRVMWVHDFPAEWPNGDRVLELDDGTTITARLQLDKPAVWRR